MSAFFVGQRVRVKWSENFPHYVGREGVIVEIGEYIDRMKFFGGEIEKYLGYVMDFNRDFAPTASQLEPILPSGHRPAELTVEELLPFLREQVTP